jgi:hypothetical protein
VPGEVIDYAARLLPVIAPGLEPPTSVRRARGELRVTRVGAPELAGLVVSTLRGTLSAVGSVGVITPDAMLDTVVEALTAAGVAHVVLGEEPADTSGVVEFDAKLDVVPASLAKGLEFDHVVLLEPDAVVAGEADRVTGLRRLYVCLTRAVTSLEILHSSPLPEELGAP